MPGEQVEKPFLPWEQGAKPTQHLSVQVLRKWPAGTACRITVTNHFPGQAPGWRLRNRFIHRFVGSGGFPEITRSEGPAEVMRDLAYHTAAERQHADHEDHSLDHRHP